MQLVCNMPVIHFQPVEQVKKKVKGEITMQISKSFYRALIFFTRKYVRLLEETDFQLQPTFA